ncbi:MAG: hypothetical protein Kow0074_04060 [Candidatus Zixiibacteriota bacterium]
MSKNLIAVTVMVLAASSVRAQDVSEMSRPVSTYSIVARDSVTGHMGVAVQSHWFSVGPIVPWAEAGVGAIATQSFVKIDYGPDGLRRLRSGVTPREALNAMLAADPGREVRQVAIVDAQGRVAAHTGDRCIAYANHLTGPGFSVQANLMEDSTVPRAMYDAFLNATGPLAERMIAALHAAEDEGGDIRGRQSAAIVIVDGERHEKAWQGRLLELRVEDHPLPVDELERLYRLQVAYDWVNQGDVYAEHGQWDSAAVAYAKGEQLAPQIVELPFWHAVTLASQGKIDEALPIFERVFRAEDRWVELVPRLVPAGLLPDDTDLMERILSVSPER